VGKNTLLRRLLAALFRDDPSDFPEARTPLNKNIFIRPSLMTGYIPFPTSPQKLNEKQHAMPKVIILPAIFRYIFVSGLRCVTHPIVLIFFNEVIQKAIMIRR